MDNSRRSFVSRFGALFAVGTLSTAQTGGLTAEEARDVAEEAYIFAYPLVMMHVTANTYMAQASYAWNKLSHLREFINAAFRTIVAPNVDVLYSGSFVDLSRQPMVLHVPEVRSRYYHVQMLDAWTETFASLGTRTTGTAAGAFVITGPGWKGDVARGVRRLDAPTDFVWVLVRIQTTGKSDLEEVHAIQDTFALKPLPGTQGSSAERPDPASATNPKLTPVMRVDGMDATEFFNTFADALRTGQPHLDDAGVVSRIARLGIARGEKIPMTRLSEPVRSAIEEGTRAAKEKIGTIPPRRPIGGNWVTSDVGVYGTQYLRRARVAKFGLGALPPEDARYARARVDADGAPLNGSHRYVLRFERGQFPPVNAFWSVTVYGPDRYFVDNPIGRYAIRDRDPAFRNADGSLEIYIQHTPPAGKEANWLPAPVGDFHLSLRMYWPRKEVVDGTWQPPPVRRQQ